MLECRSRKSIQLSNASCGEVCPKALWAPPRDVHGAFVERLELARFLPLAPILGRRSVTTSGVICPDREIAALRSYLRLRERHLDYAAAHIQHMQKALTHMNLQLHYVVADIPGATGMRIIRVIVAGERNATTLATMRDTRCKSSVETIQSALVGNYQPEHVFALAQALAMYDAYQAQLEICDQQIAQSLLQQKSPSSGPLPKPRHRTRQPNALNFDVCALLYPLVGVDLTQIHGIGPYLALRLVAECGTDLSTGRAW